MSAKRFTKEQKLQALKRLRETNALQVSKEFGVSIKTLYVWRLNKDLIKHEPEEPSGGLVIVCNTESLGEVLRTLDNV